MDEMQRCCPLEEGDTAPSLSSPLEVDAPPGQVRDWFDIRGIVTFDSRNIQIIPNLI